MADDGSAVHRHQRIQGVARLQIGQVRPCTEYAQRAQELIGRGAQVVVLPENLGVVVDPDVAQADAPFQASKAT